MGQLRSQDKKIEAVNALILATGDLALALNLHRGTSHEIGPATNLVVLAHGISQSLVVVLATSLAIALVIAPVIAPVIARGIVPVTDHVTGIVATVATMIAIDDLDLDPEAVATVAVVTVEVITVVTGIEIVTMIGGAMTGMIVDTEATLATLETTRALSSAGTTCADAATGHHAVSPTETAPLSRIRISIEGEVRRCAATIKMAAARAETRASFFTTIVEVVTVVVTATIATVAAMATATEENKLKLLRRNAGR